jgi:uncharacterized OsmC-like protein
MGDLTVSHIHGDRFAIRVRDHVITIDQPLSDGGADTAPTPVELFVASLASCVAHYARRYLVRHGLPTAGLRVTSDYTMGSRPARVADIRIDIQIPDGVPAESRAALLAVASHCTVHNTLVATPTVTVALAGVPVPAASSS